MGMIGALAWSEVGSHCSGASLREPSRKLVALSLPVSSLDWHRREAAFPKAVELNWLWRIRTSLRFSALEVPRATVRETPNFRQKQREEAPRNGMSENNLREELLAICAHTQLLRKIRSSYQKILWRSG
ncbi:hypothetical protein R1flu_029140 [Riccia fluitans]|uniref:Uncharacterized protein n=1 Tax=Riccia fluitans TaxID=41844 RepID=A0ABD1XNN7_9MARC